MSIPPLRPLESQSTSWNANCASSVSKPSCPVFNSTLVSGLCPDQGRVHADHELCRARYKAVLSFLCDPFAFLFRLILEGFIKLKDGLKDKVLYLRAKSKIQFEEPKLSKSVKAPSGYDHVVGPELVREFMNSAPDTSIIKQLAQAAHTYISIELWENCRNKELYLLDLVTAATPDQIEPLVEACRGSKHRTRVLFSSLLSDLERNDREPRTLTNEDEKKALLEKFRKAYELIRDDLPRIFVLSNYDADSGGPFTHQSHEISSIPLRLFLKWEKRLGLPAWLIQKCNDLLSYQEAIAPKAESEHLVIE